MTKQERKRKAQDLIMNQLAKIGYGDEYEAFASDFDTEEEASLFLKTQMDRVAKMFGYKEAWFY